MSRKPKKVINTTRLEDPQRGRFNLELETIDESRDPPIGFVHERLPGFFDHPDRCAPYEFTVGCDAYAKEDGFPAVLDLSAYFASDASGSRKAAKGKSIFATEFDRLNGDFSNASFPEPPATDETPASDASASSTYDQIERENERRIAEMDADELRRALAEIHERLDPATIEFLKQRSQKKKEKPTVSLFKQRQQKRSTEAKGGESRPTETAEAAGDGKEARKQQASEEKPQPKETPTSADSNFIRNLEVISDDVLQSEDLAEYSRLAMDPMHMDFASKYMRSMVPLQEKNLVRLFDKLRIPPTRPLHPNDPLVEAARSRMDAIAELFLEEFVTEQGRKERRFAADVNPLVTSGWSLVPVRRLLDARAKREAAGVLIGEAEKSKLLADDREIVELSLLWAVLLLREQPTYFNLVHGTPSEIFVRLAEVFLLGPEIFQSETIERCVAALIDEFLLPAGVRGKLEFHLTRGIAGLDTFLSFFEDLLKSFLECACGDRNFQAMILIAAYANSSYGDALTLRGILWSSTPQLVRQMTVREEEIAVLLDYVDEKLDERTRQYAVQCADSFAFLLTNYDHALRSAQVTAERNPAVWRIATRQLECAKAVGIFGQ
ncbi:RNA polymerase II-associated protein 1 domain containing protein [Aphelenchoides fujianensis]|nr:RNA polymerase II-associated protein 1 domain containing protein [Aphelenchoides fujianensis]